jgi:acyl transferase domain-containing protein
MLSVRGSWAAVTEALQAAELPDIWPANHNSPAQTVVAGSLGSLQEFARILAKDGIATHPLNVSAAFHSPLVSAAAKPLRDFMAGLDFAPPAVDVYGNADARPYPAEGRAIADRLAEQLISPVRFTEQIEAMYARGVRTFVEVGPGSTLTGLIGAILGDRTHLAVALDHRGRHGVTALHEALARLAVHGVPVDFAALWNRHAPARKPARPNSPATVMINGTNFGKGYPPPEGAAQPPSSYQKGPLPMDKHIPADQARFPLAPPQAPDTGRLQALVEIQRQTAEVQAAFQQAMTRSQLAFLAAVDSTLRGLESNGTKTRSNDAPGNGQHVRLDDGVLRKPDLSMPRLVTESFGLPEPELPRQAERMERAPEVPILPQPAPPHSRPGRSAPTDSPAGADGSGTEDLADLITEVVADRTGYPNDILRPEMHLESDLGIDSIKRVEILSVVRQRVAGLEELEAAELGPAQTLGEVIERLNSVVAAKGTGSPRPF